MSTRSIPKGHSLAATFCPWERHPEKKTPSLLCLLLSLLPPLFLPSCPQSGRISLTLSNLHRCSEKHWACCWHAGLKPHGGWQIISQPLWAEWRQPAWESCSARAAESPTWDHLSMISSVPVMLEEKRERADPVVGLQGVDGKVKPAKAGVTCVYSIIKRS